MKEKISLIKKTCMLLSFLLISFHLPAMTAQEEWEMEQREEQRQWEATIDKRKAYNPYINARFGFLVEIPTKSKLFFPQNGDGVRWIDTKSTFAGAWGSNMIFIENPRKGQDSVDIPNKQNFKQSYEEKIWMHRQGLAYHVFAKNSYVISYVEGNKIIYEKAILTPRDTVLYLSFSYPKSKQKEMKEMVERASKSFRYLN